MKNFENEPELSNLEKRILSIYLFWKQIIQCNEKLPPELRMNYSKSARFEKLESTKNEGLVIQYLPWELEIQVFGKGYCEIKLIENSAKLFVEQKIEGKILKYRVYNNTASIIFRNLRSSKNPVCWLKPYKNNFF